jgi:hypothetical protein
MKEQIKHFTESVFKYWMNRLEVQIKRNLVGWGYEI